MIGILWELALLAIVAVTASASDGHCTSFRRRSLYSGEGPARSSCPGPGPVGGIHASGESFTRNVTAPSAVMCGLICMRDGICESFRYCQDQNLCQLNITLPEEAKTVRSSGCVLFHQDVQEEPTDVTEASSTSVALPCQFTRTTAIGEFVEIPSALPAPLRIEFKVDPLDGFASLTFSANTPENQIYRIGINETTLYIKVMEDTWSEKTKTSGRYIGETISVTINGGLITLVTQGSGSSSQSPSQLDVTSWYVTFGAGDTKVQWDFVDMCTPF